MFASINFSLTIDRPILALATIFLLLVVISAVFAVKQLLFHPLSEYPGPRLGALTAYYKIYFEVWKGGGLLQEINRLHAIHGTYYLVQYCDITDATFKGQ
jgi:hypothetical protein